MPLIFKPNYTIFFAHIPKTGGSSVADYLSRRFGKVLLSTGHVVRRTYDERLPSPIEHLPASYLSAFLPDQVDLTFAVVRDPLRRLISEYRFQAGASRSSRLSFSTWLRIVLAAARTEPFLYHNHIRSQLDFLPEGCEIFRLEDGLDAVIQRIDAVTGESCPDVNFGHLLKSDRTPIVYSRQDAELVAEYYAADYAAFNYPLPDLAALPNDRFAGLRTLVAGPLARALVARQRSGWRR